MAKTDTLSALVKDFSVTSSESHLDVVHMEPGRGELEPLSLQNPLSLPVDVDLLLPALHLSLQPLHVGDEVDGLRSRSSLDGLLLHVTTGLGDLDEQVKYSVKGCGCSKAVEHTPVEQNARGFESRRGLGFSSSITSYFPSLVECP